MTGFGMAVAELKGKKVHVEVKSLNSKALDLSVRMASLYREKEMEVRQKIASELLRGKIDFAIWIERDAESSNTATLNAAAFADYYAQMKQIAASSGMPEPADYMSAILRLPEVITQGEQESLSDEEWAEVSATIDEALLSLTNFRQQEGRALETMFEEKLTNIENYLHQIENYECERIKKIKSRLLANLSQIPEAKYDNNRFEQELIYYIEKLDISEEKQRLKNHIDYFRTTMKEDAGQGKKLGFIAQEMGREINTTGSKSNHAEMQNLVVMMKDELEQIKEQVLNVL